MSDFRLGKRVWAVAAIVVGLLLLGVDSARAAGFQVVVHASNPEDTITRSELAKMFVRKVRRWDDGSTVFPVDQAPDRAVRRSFSEEIHGKKLTAIKAYWQRMIFSGRAAPPPELNSDRAVLEYVRNNRGAIGYVSAGVEVGSGVKTLRIN